MKGAAAIAAFLALAVAGCAQGLPDQGGPGTSGPDAGVGPADDPDEPGDPEPESGPDAGPGPGPSEDEGEQDPPPSSDPPPECVERTWIDLLDNGGFESGQTLWTGDLFVIQSEQMMPIPAETGAYAAWLTGYSGADEILSQEVSVPQTATELRLTGYRCFVADDPTASDDLLDVELRDSGGALLETLAAYSNQDAGTICDWESFALSAGGAYAGETIALRFHGVNGAIDPTSFYLDTLRLEAYACP